MGKVKPQGTNRHEGLKLGSYILDDDDDGDGEMHVNGEKKTLFLWI